MELFKKISYISGENFPAPASKFFHKKDSHIFSSKNRSKKSSYISGNGTY